MTVKLALPELHRLTRLLTDHSHCRVCLVPGYMHTQIPVTLVGDRWQHDTLTTGQGNILDADYDHAARPAGSDAPCSRYGTHVGDWATYAAAAAWVIASETDTSPDELILGDDHWGQGPVSLVVNDSPQPADLLVEYRHLLTRTVMRKLGGLRHLRALADNFDH
jgi:hypothetical protein